jgi:hypothetical protein
VPSALASVRALLIDEGAITRAIVLLAAASEQRSRERVESGLPALIKHGEILLRARRQMSIDAYRDARNASTGPSIEATFRTALTLSMS